MIEKRGFFGDNKFVNSCIERNRKILEKWIFGFGYLRIQLIMDDVAEALRDVFMMGKSPPQTEVCKKDNKSVVAGLYLTDTSGLTYNLKCVRKWSAILRNENGYMKGMKK